MRGYRCLKCLYLTIHHPTLEAPITPETQALFDQGNQVGALAREYYPGGILVDNAPWDFKGALAQTQALLANKTATVLYEAAFTYQNCFARADIIQYSPETKKWSLYEVKSSTKPKPEHYDDIGLQTWIMARSGLPLEKIYLLHLNTDCVYPDLSNLFTAVDITTEMREKYLSIKPKIAEMLSTIAAPTVPDIDIGSYCLAPTTCGFVDYCWKEKNIPEMSVFNLPQMQTRKWELYYQGIISLDDPRLTDLNDTQERIATCFKTGDQYINKNVIATALSEWQFPLVFLDFETINPAIPRYTGCRPYEHVPFQFSVHVWQSPEEEITHHAFLHDAVSDPRIPLIPALLNVCGSTGSIVAYFGRFESERIQALAQFSPSHRDALQNLIERIVDPLPLIREAVYDNGFAGSYSLKKVAPALLGESGSYDDMLVANGGEAQRAFEELISPKTSSRRKASLKEAMLAYCEKDTFVMVELVKWLYTQRT